MVRSHDALSWAYVTGGTLAPDAPSYVERRADRDLLDGLIAAQTCYVLNSRQMGKSSLCVRTILRLKAAGVRTVFCDLTKFGGRNLSPEQWYVALLSEIGRELGLRNEFLAYWKENVQLPPVQRLFGAITELGLVEPSNLVIFIDEIDVTLSLPFSADEFFAAIRQCYVGRATDSRLNRLSFCLLGTAAPADLVQDVRVSPFNIGKRVELQDFTLEEAAPLGPGLSSEKQLGRVLYWTGGHPYLTQRLCQAVRDSGSADVDKVCSDLFLTHAAKESDDNLAFVRNRILKSGVDLSSLLDLYRQMRRGKRVPDDETNALCAILKLSGVARVEQGYLKVRNRIYEHVFDEKWVLTHFPEAELRRQKEAYRKGSLRTAAWGSAVGAVLIVLAVSADRSASEARANATLANKRLVESNASRAQALESAEKARKERERADKQKLLAEQKTAEAVKLVKLRDQALAAERVATYRAGAEAARAKVAEANTSQQKERAERALYSANVRLMQSEYEADNLSRVADLLAETQSSPYRGFEWFYWKRKLYPQNLLLSMNLESSDLRMATYSPDGKRLVVATGDPTASVRDSRTGALLFLLKGHSLGINSAMFSRDAKRLITASSDKTAKIWDASSGHLLLTLKGHRGFVTSAAFSTDGKQVVTSSWDRSAKVWDAFTGRERLTLEGASEPVFSASFSPDGLHLVTTWDQKTAKVWDAATGAEVLTLSGHLKSINSVSYSPDGHRILTVSGDNTAILWDSSTGAPVLTLRGHTNSVNDGCFSPDGKLVVTASSDKTARVWDSFTGKEVRMIRGHTWGLSSVSFSPDSKRVVSASADKDVKVWDVATSESSGTKLHSSPVFFETLSPNGKTLVTVSAGLLKVWDLGSGAGPVSPAGFASGFTSASFSPDGKRLVTASWDKTAKVWDFATGALLATMKGHSDRISRAYFSPDGKQVVTASDDHTAKVWNATNGTLLQTFKGHRGAVYDAAFSRDASKVVTASEDNSAIVWNAKTGTKIRTLTGHTNFVYSACFSPDGSRILTGSNDFTAKLWDPATGACLHNLRGHALSVNSASFSADGNRVVTTSDDGTAKVWDAVTGAELLALKGHTTFVTCAQFSSDGRGIVTASNDMTARVWDAATLAEVRRWDRQERGAGR